ncbi:MAG: crossover junction endodeoxyribonuclease RuvC [Alkalispirochaetaceae bacterium]
MAVILGIDPGLAATGWGLIDARANTLRYIGHGVIRTDAAAPTGERLLKIHNELESICDGARPRFAAIESIYFAKNITSAIPVAQARGVAMLLLAQAGILAAEYPPQAIKQALVGHGRAAKEQVQELVRLLLALPEIPKPDHAADALAAAITYHHTRLGADLIEGGGT